MWRVVGTDASGAIKITYEETMPKQISHLTPAESIPLPVAAVYSGFTKQQIRDMSQNGQIRLVENNRVKLATLNAIMGVPGFGE
jgi:hypothetical protein